MPIAGVVAAAWAAAHALVQIAKAVVIVWVVDKAVLYSTDALATIMEGRANDIRLNGDGDPAAKLNAKTVDALAKTVRQAGVTLDDFVMSLPGFMKSGAVFFIMAGRVGFEPTVDSRLR